MNCAWQAYLNLLPPRIRKSVDELTRDTLQETRLRLQQKPLLVTGNKTITVDTVITEQDLRHCINIASEYSPWSAESAADGYITAYGGHRIGLCGHAIWHNGHMTGFKDITSLALRVCRDMEGISKDLDRVKGSILIIGSPGTGKTTLLRDLIRRRSNISTGSICVVDEREEIFPVGRGAFGFLPGKNTDVLSRCPKSLGIGHVLRTMGPTVIVVDEITREEDCNALIQAVWCGIELIATAHARDIQDFISRPVYKPLVKSGIFQTIVVLRQDKTWYLERIRV